MTHRFRKCQHLLKGTEFRRAFRGRTSVADNVLIVYGAPNELGFSRLGLSVSRKVGNAVVRNWWKRRLRESFRLAESLPSGIDFVVIPRSRTQPEYRTLDESFQSLAQRVYRKLNRRQASP